MFSIRPRKNTWDTVVYRVTTRHVATTTFSRNVSKRFETMPETVIVSIRSIISTRTNDAFNVSRRVVFGDDKCAFGGASSKRGKKSRRRDVPGNQRLKFNLGCIYYALVVLNVHQRREKISSLYYGIGEINSVPNRISRLFKFVFRFVFSRKYHRYKISTTKKFVWKIEALFSLVKVTTKILK